MPHPLSSHGDPGQFYADRDSALEQAAEDAMNARNERRARAYDHPPESLGEGVITCAGRWVATRMDDGTDYLSGIYNGHDLPLGARCRVVAVADYMVAFPVAQP